MDQKPPQSDGPQTPAGADQSAPANSAQPVADSSHNDTASTPKPEEHTPASSQQPDGSANNSQPAQTPVSTGGGDTPTIQPSQPVTPPGAGIPDPAQEHQIHRSNTMLFAIITLFIVIIGAVLVTIMSGTSQPQQAPSTAAQPTEPQATTTPLPTEEPTPATIEEEIETVNVTEDDADIKEAEQDLQAL